VFLQGLQTQAILCLDGEEEDVDRRSPLCFSTGLDVFAPLSTAAYSLFLPRLALKGCVRSLHNLHYGDADTLRCRVPSACRLLSLRYAAVPSPPPRACGLAFRLPCPLLRPAVAVAHSAYHCYSTTARSPACFYYTFILSLSLLPSVWVGS